jgi:hypothetical protein
MGGHCPGTGTEPAPLGFLDVLLQFGVEEWAITAKEQELSLLH